MRSLKTVLAVLGAVTVLVLAGNTIALAATGHSLLAGKVNTSSRTTTIKRTTGGAGLAVHTKYSANAPFAVNGHGRVPNLNADYVDGLTSLSLRNHSYVFDAEPATDQRFVSYAVSVPDGSYVVSYTAFLSQLSGDGGVECFISEDHGKSHEGITTGLSAFYANHSSDTSLTGSGVVTKSSTQSIFVSCVTQNNNQSFNVRADVPLQIVATPTKVVSHKTVEATPVEEAFR
jgi:hypothetical protein